MDKVTNKPATFLVQDGDTTSEIEVASLQDRFDMATTAKKGLEVSKLGRGGVWAQTAWEFRTIKTLEDLNAKVKEEKAEATKLWNAKNFSATPIKGVFDPVYTVLRTALKAEVSPYLTDDAGNIIGVRGKSEVEKDCKKDDPMANIRAAVANAQKAIDAGKMAELQLAFDAVGLSLNRK